MCGAALLRVSTIWSGDLNASKDAPISNGLEQLLDVCLIPNGHPNIAERVRFLVPGLVSCSLASEKRMAWRGGEIAAGYVVTAW